MLRVGVASSLLSPGNRICKPEPEATLQEASFRRYTEKPFFSQWTGQKEGLFCKEERRGALGFSFRKFLLILFEFSDVIGIRDNQKFGIGLNAQLRHVLTEFLHVRRNPRLDGLVDDQPQDP